MRRYEWMYDEEAWESQMQEEKVEPSPREAVPELSALDRSGIALLQLVREVPGGGEGESRRLILDIGGLEDNFTNAANFWLRRFDSAIQCGGTKKWHKER